MDAKQKAALVTAVEKAIETLNSGLEEFKEAFTVLINSFSADVSAPAEEVEEVEEKKPATRTRKKAAEKPAEKPVPNTKVKEAEEDPTIALVNKAVKDMTNEEIAEVLVDVGMSATGKREALIAKVVKAVNEGKIELEDSEDGSEDESEEDEDEVEEVENEEAEEEEDILDEYALNDIENEDMPEERREAIIDYSEGIKEDFASKKITRKQLIDWLNEVNGTKDTMKKVSDDDLVAEYTHLLMLRVSDSGDFMESGEPYTVNGIPYCCGNPLIEGEETYSCGVCKEEYELAE